MIKDPLAAGSTTVSQKNVEWTYGGNVEANEDGGCTITPGKGYAIDRVLTDGTSYQEQTYHGSTGSCSFSDFSSVTDKLTVEFSYLLDLKLPEDGGISVKRDGKEISSGEIVRRGEILVIEPADKEVGTIDESKLTLSGVKKQSDGTYQVTAVLGEATPSIDVSNAFDYARTLAAPVFTPTGGEVAYNTKVAITCAAAKDAVIYYTTDGTSPSTASTQYTGPIAITDDVTLKAVAAAPLYKDSGVASAAYTVKRVGLTAAPSDQGTVSFTVDNKTVTQAIPGSTVKVVVTPETGYALEKLTYTYEGLSAPVDITGTQSFPMPEQPVTVTAAYRIKYTDATIETVTTPEDLIRLALEVNDGVSYAGRTVTLANNIVLSGGWTPIGTYEAPFMGTFDGNEKTISGLDITYTWEQYDAPEGSGYIGLFGYVRDAEIKDLTVEGAINLKMAGGPSANRWVCVGGIIGGTGSPAKISNCISIVDITADRLYGRMGGIVGLLGTNGISDTAEEKRSTLTGCINHGNLEVTDNFSGDLGGVAGCANLANISQCGNYGNLKTEVEVRHNNSTTAGGDFRYSSGLMGGVLGDCPYAGRINEAEFNYVVLDSCFNVASVYGTGEVMGGVAGRCPTIRNCYNTGDVTSTTEDNIGLGPSVGGVAAIATRMSNCYSTGTASSTAPKQRTDPIRVDCAMGREEFQEQINCYSKTDTFDAAALGEAFQADVNNINGGCPLLAWQPNEADPTPRAVTFAVTPASASVTVYSDPAMTQTVGTGLTYSLPAGTYYYKVTSASCVPETGSFAVSIRAVTVSVTLQQSSAVTFKVSPADADFALADASGNAVAPDSAGGGTYVYTLYTGRVYVYSAYAEGYSSVSREYEVTADQTVNVTLSKPTDIGDLKPGVDLETQGTIYGDGNPGQTYTIEDGGIYQIGKGATGILTVATSDPVVLQGYGVGLNDAFDDLYINCTEEGSDLTLQNVYISNTSGTTNTIGFTGRGNELMFADLNIIDQNTGASGFAMIHVGEGDSLTVTGGTAYLYKRDQGAGIGGNGGANVTNPDGSMGQAAEYNGDITISGATLYMKNSKQGALIGSGAASKSTAGSPGDITIEDSELYMITISRGAAIGGAAGSGGGSPGSNMRVSDSIITINVDYSGAAIGGGGYGEGNDSDGGTLYYDSGSIRTYIDTNAVMESLWNSFGVTKAGVNGNKAITADVVNDSGEDLYLLELDTSSLSGRSFTVKEGNSTVYSGGLHRYSYVNEGRPKDSQLSIQYTMENWGSLSDPNLYLYLTGEDHDLTIGSATVEVEWSSSDKAFSYVIKNAAGEVIGGGGTAGTPKAEETKLKTETVIKDGKATVIVDSESLAETLESIPANTQLVITADIPASTTVTETTVVLTRGDAGAIADANASLKVSTPLAGITLPTEALQNLAGTASRKAESVTITASVQENGTRIEIAANGTVLSAVGGGLTVSLPADKKDLTAGSVMVLVDAAGNETVIKKSAVGENCVLALVDGSCTVKVVDNSQTFADVADSAWYAGAVAFAVSHELFNGTSDTAFDPTGLMTRGMLVTVLHRLENTPSTTASAAFGDVSSDAWYTGAVHWANENGIVTGYSDNVFGPGDSITREQLAVMMYRYMQYIGLDVSVTAKLDSYSDRTATSDWALEAMQWAVGAGLIQGKSETMLDPSGTATRAEVATMLQRLLNLMVQ